MINLYNVSKTYKQNKITQEVLKDISFSLPDTGLVTVLGDSGSGKTTLLNCIGGLENFKGKITINDFSFSKENKHLNVFRRKNIGYVFQDFCLIEDKTVLENIQQALNIARNNEENDKEKIKNVLDFVGMKNYINRKVSSLSGGQKQRVGIARALINDAKVILADEPTGHLDNKNTKKIMEIFRKISSTSLVIIVTHEKEIADTYSDRIIEICDGTISDDYENKATIKHSLSTFSLEHSNKVKHKEKAEPFKYIFSFTKSRIAAIILFIFSSIFVALSMSFSVFSADKDYTDYFEHPRNALQIQSKSNGPFTEREFNNILSMKNAISFLPTNTLTSFDLTCPPLLQTSTSSFQLMTCACPISGAKEIIYGSAPKKPYEIIIDEFLCNRLINTPSTYINSAKQFGFISPDNFINSYIRSDNKYEYKIVGVSKSYSPCLYFNENDLISLYIKEELKGPQIYNNPEIINQSFSLEENEVIINSEEYVKGKYSEKNNEIEILGSIYKIKDTYTDLNSNTIFMSLKDMKNLYWKNYLSSAFSLFLLCENELKAKEDLIELDYYCITTEELAEFSFLQVNRQGQIISNVFAVLICIAAAFIYLLSEKKRINEMLPEISVKRLLGQSKYKVLFHLLFESFLTILIFASPFYLLSSIAFNGIAASLGTIVSFNQIPIGKLFLGLGLLFLISILITFIISIPLLKRSPASLNKAKE